MDTYAGTTLMGSQPVAGRARAMHVCVSGRSIAAHTWLGAMKPATQLFTITAVPATNRTRRPRGSP